MKAFWAIVKLTNRNAMRSHVFQLLLVLLLIAVLAIPLTINGDGTAMGYIRIALQYSLASIMFILSLSSVWLSCHAMTQDVESYQLHMVISKPVSRVTVWLAKATGVLCLHLLLLFLSAIMVFFAVQYRYQQQDFPQEERDRIANEVMVGRRAFLPSPPDIEELVSRIYQRQIERMQKAGQVVDNSPVVEMNMKKEIRHAVAERSGEVPFQQRKEWIYDNLPTNLTQPIFLRYRNYVAKVDTKDQRSTRGIWLVGIPQVAPEDAKTANGEEPETKFLLMPLSQAPMEIRSGEFHELALNPEWISPEGRLVIVYGNFDPEGEAQFFQPSDGPKLLLPVTGFTQNYFRAVIVGVLQLLVLIGLSCAAAGVLSMPMGIFVVASYLLFGMFAQLMVSTDYLSGVSDYIGYLVGYVVMFFVIPMQEFQVTNLVSGGELVEFSLIGKLALMYFVIRALPLVLLGIWLYRRREMGLVIRK